MSLIFWWSIPWKRSGKSRIILFDHLAINETKQWPGILQESYESLPPSSRILIWRATKRRWKGSWTSEIIMLISLMTAKRKEEKNEGLLFLFLSFICLGRPSTEHQQTGLPRWREKTVGKLLKREETIGARRHSRRFTGDLQTIFQMKDFWGYTRALWLWLKTRANCWKLDHHSSASLMKDNCSSPRN